MWYGIRLPARTEAGFVTSATDLLQSTSKQLILLVAGVCVFWYFVGVVALPDSVSMKLFPIAVLVVLASTFSAWLLSRSAPAAQAVWQVGLAVAVTLAACVSRRSEVGFLYTLLPLIAALSVGWRGALFSAGLVSAAVCWLTHNPAMAAFSSSYGAVVSAGAAATGLIGWVAARSYLTVTQWSLLSFERAQQKVDEALDQRLELKQVQQDLMLATSELARLTDRLKAMHQVAEEARQAKERFVANVSHELRTPLNMIIGFSEMITESPRLYGTTLPPALLADIEVIQRNSQHLARLVNDVLDLSQVEAGRMALSREWCSLSDILEEAVLAVRALFDNKGLYLKMDVPTDLPRAYCDSTRVRQVVLNLLSNAGRFTASGGVSIRARGNGDSLVVSITDTGPGIPVQEQARLFEPFQQLDRSLASAHEGSGLGLSISKQFVELHGGRMWLESTEGAGSTIHFSLPLVPSSADTSEDSVRRWFSPYLQYEGREGRSKAPAPSVVPRFVVLEQDRVLSRMLARYMDGAEITSVGTIEEALDELGRSPAMALVVNASSDEQMADSARQLPSIPYDTPVMICRVPTEAEAARQLGALCYLTKPVSREGLRATLAELGPDCRSVLVVDDEPEMLQLITRMLSAPECQYQPLQAANGERALDLLRQRHPDVVLLDLIMPGMDGFQVLQAKSRDPAIRDIPVVVISARNPGGEPIVSDSLAVSRSGGLSAHDLLGCLLAVSEVLSPGAEPCGRGRPGSRA